MKKIRLSTILTLTFILVASLVLSVSFARPAKASDRVFEIEYGASIKISGDGLRFKAKMDEEYYNYIVDNDTVKLYGYIAPTEEFDKVSEYKDISNKVGGALDEGKIYEKDGYYHANIVITNLKERDFHARSFSAILYIYNESTKEYIYADLAKDETGVSNIDVQNRTQYQIINSAFLDAEESYEQRLVSAYPWYGASADLPIMILSEADYNAFVSKLSASNEFAQAVSGKHVFIKQSVNEAIAGYSADKKIEKYASLNTTAGHVVTFWDGNKKIATQFVEDGADAGITAPEKDGYEFVDWVGNLEGITADTNIYTKWKFAKGNLKDLGELSVYGVTRADGATVASDSDVIGQKVVLAGGDSGDGIYFPGETNEVPDPTDENNTVDQAYLAFDGQYGFNDYFVADFTGKNMPTMAFFANNYNNSIFYGDGTKNGVVVATGFTHHNGELFTADVAYSTSVFNGKGICAWGPHMIYNTGNNNNPKGVLLHPNTDIQDVAIGRANLDSGTSYRVIMGFVPGDDLSNFAIKLVYVLYNLDEDCIVESKEINTYNFFTNGWANAGQTRDQFCLGSIVAYGYLGTPTVLDKVYDIYEDTTIEDISAELGMQSLNNATVSGDSIVLENGTIGEGASYTKGQNAGGSITQSYYAINGDYDFDDYLVLDFTGKNMPEVMFFAENYDNTMYYSQGKQGVVVASGITLHDGTTGSAQSNNTKVGVSGPFGAYFEGAAEPYGGNMMSDIEAKLARANLDDSKQYRVIMGITKATDSRAFTLEYLLYDLTNNAVVEEISETSWNFFSGSNAAVGSMTRDGLVGSIVLYGKFGTTCTIDKLHGVYENTTINAIKLNFGMDPKTVTFKNWDGTVLEEVELFDGEIPEYTGETPVRAANAVISSYEFIGWDKEITAVTADVTYTAVFSGTKRDGVTFSGGSDHTYGVELSNDKIVLKAGGIGDGANYTLGQNNGGYVHQSYLALDGNFNFDDYVAFDFTGKNMPEVMFFGKNYDNTMYYSQGKQGVVVASGITLWDGTTGSAQTNNTKVGVSGPFGAYFKGAASPYGGNMMSDFSSQLARANLEDGTQYRVIMGITQSGTTFTLNYLLYNLTTGEVVENVTQTSWAFFTGGNAAVNNMTLDGLSGSIVLYGKFGVACTLDKVYGVFENTDIATVANGLNGSDTYTVTWQNTDGAVYYTESAAYGTYPTFKMETPKKESSEVFDYVFSWDKALSPVTADVTYTAKFEAKFKSGVTGSNVTEADDSIVLGKGNIGAGADYTKGQNAGGSIYQSYLAIDGNFNFDDYVAFDFTGKNMPEVMFFGKNYDNTMYYSQGKQGVVVASGITLWDGTAGSAQANNAKVGVSGPFGAYFESAAEPHGGNMLSDFEAKLARANLVDGTQYRVIMGITQSGTTAFTLNYLLYNLTTGDVVENVTQTSWAFFTGANPAVNNMTLDGLSGSIVLYGKFGTTCTIDKIHGVFENTDIATVVEALNESNDGSGEDGGEEPAPSTGAPDYSKYTDQFDFYAYSSYSDGTYEIDGEKYYIGKNLANLKQYSLYGGVGMTIYFPQNDMLINNDPETVVRAKKLIDDLAKVGIKKTILLDSRISYLSMLENGLPSEYNTNDKLDAYIYNCLKDYATYPGVYGVMLGDEPKYACLDEYAAVYNSIKRVNAANGWNLFIQYNLNPLNVSEEVYTNYYPATTGTYAWNDYRYRYGIRDRFTDTVTRYTQYINDFLNAMNPDSIMYDDYPLMENKSGGLEIKDSYIPCLQIVAKAAADRGIKFYHVTQTYENNASGMVHRRAVTEKGAKWLNNILLGFGTKQIAYYTYYTRAESDSSGAESYVDGQSFVDYNGNPTSLYGWMKAIMANNQKFAPTVLQFDYKGSRVYGSTSANHLGEITVSNSFTKLSNFAVNTGSALVTELYDDENDNYMYMAMNVLDPDASSTAVTATMTFSGYQNVLVYVDGVATTHALSNGAYSATLNPGEAVYVIPYN